MSYPTGSKNSGNFTSSDDFSEFNLIGRSSRFLKVLEQIRSIASLDVTVTIYGETGTGKELIARAVHYSGGRSGGPFIPINCGALPDTLFENEMFGHERGAFTDASRDQAGLVAHAEGGTLFLDEIEALTPKAQVALLRFLQDKTYRPLGGSTIKSADVRIVAASNESFGSLITQRGFRTDLYYRLNLIPLKIPPLRDRGGDIMLLTNHFMGVFQHQYQRPDKHLGAEALEAMRHYHWPGNVRELEATLHRAFLLSENTVIKSFDLFDDLPDEMRPVAAPAALLDFSFRDAKTIAMTNFEQSYLSLLMEKFDGNISAASAYSGKERSALSKLIKKHQL